MDMSKGDEKESVPQFNPFRFRVQEPQTKDGNSSEKGTGTGDERIGGVCSRARLSKPAGAKTGVSGNGLGCSAKSMKTEVVS